VRLDGAYKYCPNCSYRLRPDLARHHLTEAEPIQTSQRLLALGGYLGFVSLLLVLVLAGLRLFGTEGPPPVKPQSRISFAASEARLDRGDLVEVPGGLVAWGSSRPDSSAGALRDLLRSMPSAPEAGANPHLDDWLARARFVLEERTQELLPEIYRVDDDFSIGVSEITQEQWFAFLVARAERSGSPTPGSYIPASWTRGSGIPRAPRLYAASRHGDPVSDIDFVAALEFCNWVWEEVFESNPDYFVDLPTPLEFARAGRADSYDNFPWGPRLVDERVVLHGKPEPVLNGAAVGLYRGLYGQVGNVAEWIHFGNGCGAAGWSYLDSARRRDADRGEWRSPFSSESVEDSYGLSDRERHVGFRIVVRYTPAAPRFASVSAGPVRFVRRPSPVLPPLDEVRRPLEEGGEVEVVTEPRPAVPLPERPVAVAHDFEIAVSEVTNRQYLRFLDAASQSLDATGVRELLPRGFRFRLHPFAGREVVYPGPFGDPESIRVLFEAGRENHPVQNVTPEQAQEFARWLGAETGGSIRLPTAEEFVRAGRGDGDSPYPWGDSPVRRELVCDGDADDQDRAASLFPFLRERPDAIVGLCGNVLELVRAPGGAPDAPWLLAGGCYEFEAEACTLDAYLDPAWKWADIDVDGVRVPYVLQQLTGFRVVRTGSRR
jgi:formylglycine-generating enzyme required for sulfatase activity